MLLSKKQTTKALIRLRRCAGWSAPVLIANLRRQVFSRRGPHSTCSEIHMILKEGVNSNYVTQGIHTGSYISAPVF